MTSQATPTSTGWPLSRRAFLKVSAVAGASLTVAVYLSGCESATPPAPTAPPTAPPAPTLPPPAPATLEPTATPEPAPTAEPPTFLQPNIYLTVDGAGIVTIRAFRSELGQGIRTAIATIVADELDADWADVRIEQSPVDRAYGDQVTGGSVSVSSHYRLLRSAGATARQVLIAAAAQTWGVDAAACRTDAGQVIHPDGQVRLSYGELVATAISLPVPNRDEVKLKEPDQFRFIGKPRLLYDAPAMARGTALYTGDLRLPGMMVAVVARCPVFGGKVAGVVDDRARAVPGVRDVVPITTGIAVVAENTWSAIQGRAALEVTWDEGAQAELSSEATRQELIRLAPEPASQEEGVMAAAYDIPYLAHATMEPMAAVADVRADRCEVWAPSQAPQAARQQAMAASKLSEEAVTVHVPLVGGAFGRRHVNDFVGEAVEISRATGVPISLLWTRDDDIQHDRYHPINRCLVSARLDETGRPTSMPRVQAYPMPIGVPTGYWRSVENFPAAFARESFLDEVAAAKGLDPVELRLGLVPDRARAVIELAAEKAGWGSSLPEGWGRGIAYWPTFNVTHVAHVAEVSVVENRIRVHRVVCVVDCGTVVNPDTVVAQMEGGIVFGLTAALKASITVAQGRVQQSNFHDYPLLRFDEMPAIETTIVPSTEAPSGIGEMGVPPIAPAVANAVFAATGKRVRHIPIRAEDLK
ncbi:MAG TPA: molybdopterin cofactor-binding domain-containing protein [Anaerolineae bacterium]|nr:molybdopterin cofactor-binding domain-containing protein [Anaerolineae bacterium]